MALLSWIKDKFAEQSLQNMKLGAKILGDKETLSEIEKLQKKLAIKRQAESENRIAKQWAKERQHMYKEIQKQKEKTVSIPELDDDNEPVKCLEIH